MKQPNLTKNHTEQTVSPFENNIMTKKTESTERGQKRRFEYEKTKFKHMFSEEDSTYNRKVGNSIYGHNGSPLIQDEDYFNQSNNVGYPNKYLEEKSNL